MLLLCRGQAGVLVKWSGASHWKHSFPLAGQRWSSCVLLQLLYRSPCAVWRDELLFPLWLLMLLSFFLTLYFTLFLIFFIVNSAMALSRSSSSLSLSVSPCLARWLTLVVVPPSCRASAVALDGRACANEGLQTVLLCQGLFHQIAVIHTRQCCHPDHVVPGEQSLLQLTEVSCLL